MWCHAANIVSQIVDCVIMHGKTIHLSKSWTVDSELHRQTIINQVEMQEMAPHTLYHLSVHRIDSTINIQQRKIESVYFVCTKPWIIIKTNQSSSQTLIIPIIVKFRSDANTHTLTQTFRKHFSVLLVCYCFVCVWVRKMTSADMDWAVSWKIDVD